MLSDYSRISKPVFSNCGPMKKSKIHGYGEGPQERPETIH